MAEIFQREKTVFFSPFFTHKKTSKNQNFEKSLICAIVIVVKNTWEKFQTDQFHQFRRFYQQGVEKHCFKKNPFKHFLNEKW